jgi:hypothetical protein
MHEQLSYLRKKPVDILIDDCNFEFLDYYLSIHLLYHRESSVLSNSEDEDISLWSRAKSSLPRTKHLVTLQPSIHRVIEKGNMRALRYLIAYFQGKDVPSEFSVHALNETLGENSALVAVRAGNLEMIKFLHETCQVDFCVLNKRREGAIQVAAAASKKKPRVAFLLVLRFLIEELGVEVGYNYEETLMLCEDRDIIAYLEFKLAAQGINVKKSELKDVMPVNCVIIHHADSEQVAEMRYYEKASVSELIREEHERRNSLSSIRRLSQESTFTQDLPF